MTKRYCRKGIILAGGAGSRLFPLTAVCNKQTLPVYDKPVIYYPLTSLMLAGIDDILVISSPDDLPKIQELLGDGQQWGVKIQYQAQTAPRGLPDAFILGEKFIANEPVCLILGDNLYHGDGFSHLLIDIAQEPICGVHLFAYTVHDPERYGVVVLDENDNPIDIEEKPKQPKSNLAVTGLYFYDNTVVERAKQLKPSKRGELEITDLNRHYMQSEQAKVHVLSRGYVWFDVGTPESLAQASEYVKIMQTRQGTAIACPEEVAWRMEFIDNQQFGSLVEALPNCQYAHYLKSLKN